MAKLPTDPHTRSQELVRRSLPAPDAPALDMSPEAASRLRECRNTRALLYASMEDLSDRIGHLAEEVEASGVVVDVINPDDEDSLVTAIDALDESLDCDLGELLRSA